MKDIKATATAHMRRDLEDGATWACTCEACAHVRSLVGVEKMLDVRPLVRAIEQKSAQLHDLPPGPERQRLSEECLRLHDRLAEVIAE
jgi:hypothetical protein